MPAGTPETAARTMTLEAFADTIIPGGRRAPDDHAVAGATDGGGAVAAGAVDLREHPASGLAEQLDAVAAGLNANAAGYAAGHGLALDEALPPFVALPFEHRTALVSSLVAPGRPDQDVWVGIALFSNMAFDSAAHLSTADAMAAGHPGLATIGWFTPEADGAWRFPRFSYQRQLASLHPDTTATGSPA